MKPYQKLGSIESGKNIGPKALVLDQLIKKGLPVPEGFVVPGGPSFRPNKAQLKNSIKNLNTASLCVRSAALAEDGSIKSRAGRFLSVLDIVPSAVESAMAEVLKHGQKIEPNGKIIPLIIQAYLKFDLSGVVFTVNPLNGQDEYVISYSKLAQAATSGNRPITEIRLAKNAKHDSREKPVFIPALISLCRRIENILGPCQDIEFGVSKGKIFILQSRPVTGPAPTINEEIKRLTKNYNQTLFKRNDLREAAPQPTPLSLEILKKLYSPEGALGQALDTLGIYYKRRLWNRRPYLDTIFGSIMVNKDLEQKIFSGPSLGQKILKPSLFGSGLNRLIKTKKQLHAFPLHFSRQAAPAIVALGSKTLISIESFLDELNGLYQNAFIANLLLNECRHLLKYALGQERADLIAMQKVISSKSAGLEYDNDILAVLANYSFRTKYDFELACRDYSRPDAQSIEQKSRTGKNNQNITGLSARQEKIIRDFKIFLRLTQDSRHLFAFALDHLRRHIHNNEKYPGFAEEDDICYLKSSEIDKPPLNALKIINERKNRHKILSRKKPRESWLIPQELFTAEPELDNNFKVLSPGRAEGILAGADDLKDNAPDEKIILLTPVLSPDIIISGRNISGFIAENGNSLSHGAILAREYSLPAILMPQAKKLFQPGDRLLIDTAKHKIEKCGQ